MKINKKVVAVVALSLLVISTANNVITFKSVTKKNKKRRFSVRPLNQNRDREGFFATLVKGMESLEWDHDQYFKYTRMTPQLFKYLLSLVGPSLQKKNRGLMLSPEKRLMMTIHYLAQGCSMQELAWAYRVGKSTVHYIIKDTCKNLWDVLSPVHLPKPTKENWKSIAKGFYSRWNLPNCIGALDGKHITIKAPIKSGSLFYNYKKSFSIILMATCDSYYRFTMVDIGAAGGNHDCTVFKDSGFGTALLNKKLNIPPPTNLPGTNSPMPYFLAADAAFPLHENIMRPFPGKYLGEKKNIYNYRLSRGRRVIENTFGILAQRWRILRRPIEASVEVCELITQATVVLHNFLQNCESDLLPSERRYCPTGLVDFEDCEGNIQPGLWRSEQGLQTVKKVGSNNSSSTVKNMRDRLCDYFVSPVGSVAWQEDYVSRGAMPEKMNV